MLAPLVAQVLVESGHIAVSFACFAIMSFVGAASSFSLSTETAGLALRDGENEDGDKHEDQDRLIVN